MDVAFLVHIGFSFGEAEHALSFAQQAEAAGYRAHFVASDRIAHHLRAAGRAPAVYATQDELLAAIERIDPALVVGSELFNLPEDAVRALAATGRRLATMDATTLGREINTDPLKAGAPRAFALPDGCIRLLACPVHDVAPDGDGAFHWPLLEPEPATDAARDPARWRALGLDPARKTLLLAIAPWQTNGARHAGVARYPDALVVRIADALVAIGDRVQLLVVAKGAAGALERGALRVVGSDLLPFDAYRHVLATCDAVLSDNVIQTSVSKAVVRGTPHLVIQNLAPLASASPVGRGGLLSSELPFRCNMFPLKHVFPAERAYAQIVDTAEYADAAGLRDRLAAVLRVGYVDAARRARRRRYVERLAGLARPGAILAQLLGPARRPAVDPLPARE
jgi:hypothetical protein